MKASLSNYRISPRKIRLVAGLVKGKSVSEALDQLKFLTKRGAHPVAKLIQSAVANASHNNKLEGELVVKSVRVDGGIVMKRFMPRAYGRGAQILKRTSHVLVELAPKAVKEKKAKTAKAKAK